MPIKLIKACKDLNVGMATAIEVLAKGGYNVLHDPNVRLSNYEFNLLVGKFANSTAIKN